jgi:hypothetical protein
MRVPFQKQNLLDLEQSLVVFELEHGRPRIGAR